MLINNAVITGSFIVNGVDVTGITGSSNVSSSYLALSSSYLVTSASYAVTSGSYASASGSLSIRTSNLEATSSTLVSASSSFAADSASLSTRLTTDETNFTNLSSSFATTSGSIAGRVTIIEGQDATTGSNVFTGTQYVSEASNAISFTSTASLYTDGGLRVAKSAFISGTAYFNDVVVYGTSSIQYITSSNLDISDNIITVNTFTPAVRFGGLAVYDSGSTGLTGSILWDSEKNNWIYSNPSGSTYDGGMIMSGPKNTSGLGNEQGTLNNYITKGQGGDHITSSQIIDDGTTVRIPGNLQVTGSLVGSSTATFSDTVTISKAAAISSLIIKSSSSTTGLWLYLNGLNATLSNQDNGSLAFQTNGTDRLTISSTGAATFSSSVTANGNLNLQGAVTRNINFYDSSNTNINAQIQYDQISSNSGQLFFGTNNAGTFATRLTIANTGAATFSAATQDAIQTVVRISGNNASSQLKALDFKLTAGTPLWTISTAAVGTDAGINIMPNGTSGLSLAYTGAATFTNTETTFNFNPQTNLLASYNYINFGGGSIMYRNATDIYIGSNAKYGSAGTVIASYTSLYGMGLLTMDAGTLNYQANDTSVTAGTSYGVPIRFTIKGNGLVSINNVIASSSNYKLGVSGSAYINGSNNKGIFVTDNSTYASIVGLNSAISAYNPLEIRASGTDGQIILHTSGNVSIGNTTDTGDRLYLAGNLKMTTNGKIDSNGGYLAINSATGGNVLIGTTTDDTIGKLQVTGNVTISNTAIISRTRTNQGSVSNPYNVWTTMFSVSTGDIAMYQLIAVSSGNGLTYTSTALVVVNGSSVGLYNKVDGGALDLQASGYAIQCKNGSGSTLNINWTYLRIS